MAEVTNVQVIPSRPSNLATAIRGHLNASLAYMRMDMESEMEAEFDSIDMCLEMLKEQARLRVAED